MMLRKVLTLLTLLSIFALVLTGCKEKTEAETVKPVSEDEAKQVAEKEITSENLDEELKKLEEEISADTE